jgi:hypothetical protein
MLQDQNAQTANSNKNFIEQVNELEISEEQLWDITGGCAGCAFISGLALGMGIKSVSKGEIPRAIATLTISADSAKTTSTRTQVCKNCVINGTLLAAIAKK